jgi:hypothetical protein
MYSTTGPWGSGPIPRARWTASIQAMGMAAGTMADPITTAPDAEEPDEKPIGAHAPYLVGEGGDSRYEALMD